MPINSRISVQKLLQTYVPILTKTPRITIKTSFNENGAFDT